MLPLTLITLMLFPLAQGPVTGDRPAARTTPLTITQPAVVLQEALADFDAAVAIKERTGPDAQRLYRRALAGFDALERGGTRTPGLYYNLGNTHLRLGELGKAIVNYRRGLRLVPGEERIRKNLDSARRLCQVQIAEPATTEFVETLLFWHFGTSLSERTQAALGAYVLFWILLALRRFIGRGQPGFLGMILLIGAFALIVGASAAWDTLITPQHPEGVLTANQSLLRKGNGDYYEPLLEKALSEGVEFRLLETREDVQGASWYLIELRDGKKGWLRSEQAEII